MWLMHPDWGDGAMQDTFSARVAMNKCGYRLLFSKPCPNLDKQNKTPSTPCVKNSALGAGCTWLFFFVLSTP